MNSLSSFLSRDRVTPIEWSLLWGSALLRFVNLGFLDLQAWDEALYSIRAETVLRFGLWIDQTPKAIDGLYSSLHPPLYVWLTSISYWVLGISEFSSRLVSALSGALAVFAMFYLGRACGSKKTGMIAALLFSLTPFMLFFSRQGQFDTLMVLFLILAAYPLITTIETPSISSAVFSGLFVGAALLTKLFVGFGIPLSYAVWIALAHPVERNRHWRNLAILFLIAVAVALPWHLFMSLKHGHGNPLFFLEASSLLERTFSGIEGNVKPLGPSYYVNQLIVLFPLGCVWFTTGFWHGVQSRNSVSLFLLVWFSVFFLVFSFMQTKLAVYLLPMLVPASIVAARVLEEPFRFFSPRSFRLALSATGVSFLWALNQEWRNGVREIIESFISGSWPEPSSLTAAVALLLMGAGLIGVLWTARRRMTILASYLPAIVLVILFLQSTIDVIFLDRTRFNDGGAALADFVRTSRVSRIVVAGYEHNPQLTYYLAGADIDWRSDISVRRIKPPADSHLYRQWINDEMTGEPSSSLLLIEKDKFIRYHQVNPGLFIPEEYVIVFESRRYSAYARRSLDFLASSCASRSRFFFPDYWLSYFL